MDSPVQYVYSDICRCWLGRIPSINHLYREIIPENKSNHRKLFIMLSKILTLSLLRKECPFLKPGVAFSFISLFCGSSDKLWSRVAAECWSCVIFNDEHRFWFPSLIQRSKDCWLRHRNIGIQLYCLVVKASHFHRHRIFFSLFQLLCHFMPPFNKLFVYTVLHRLIPSFFAWTSTQIMGYLSTRLQWIWRSTAC